MKNIVKSALLVVVAALVAFGFNSCKQDPYRYEVTKGEPVIKYITSTHAESADSIITSAGTEATIAIIGDNLRSIKKVFFNDQEALLSPSFINHHTLIITIPASLPDVITNKIYFHAENGNIVEYPFVVEASGPKIDGISCEYILPGTQGIIYGKYFVNKEASPLTVIMPDGKNAEIISFEQTKIVFKVPEGCTQPGRIVITTAFGEGKSDFFFNDNRNIILDFDGEHGGLPNGNGWRPYIHKPDGTPCDHIPQISGDFLYMSGVPGDWNDNGYEFDCWSGPGRVLSERPEFAAMLNNNDPSTLCVKFECYIPTSNPWCDDAMQILFQGDVQDNSACSTPTYPRGLWKPWADKGSYDTNNQWTTVTLPLSDFIYTNDGKNTGKVVYDDLTNFHGLTIFVNNGGERGTKKDQDTNIAIDNFRVVPLK